MSRCNNAYQEKRYGGALGKQYPYSSNREIVEQGIGGMTSEKMKFQDVDSGGTSTELLLSEAKWQIEQSAWCLSSWW